MTKSELDAIRERCEKATEGPWISPYRQGIWTEKEIDVDGDLQLTVYNNLIVLESRLETTENIVIDRYSIYALIHTLEYVAECITTRETNQMSNLS